MKKIAGKIAYITGGSSGIGLATARLLVRAGAHVLILARTPERLENAARELEAIRGSEDQRIAWMQLDVSDREEVDRVTARAVEAFGAPDLLVNNAGWAEPRPFEEIPYEQFDSIMKINFYGAWHMISALLPHMKRRGGGHIVNVSSIAGFLGVYGYADYCASKFAMVGLSETLRCELKPYGIGISVLYPPDTDTPGFEMESRNKPAETRAISGTAKLLQPEQVARALLEGVRKNRFNILVNTEGRLIHLTKRLFPWMLEWFMDRKIRKVREAAE